MALPTEFIERLNLLYPEQATDILESLKSRRDTTLRANTLKISTDELYQKLTNKGFELEVTSFFSDAYILRKGLQRDLTATEEYKEGLFYIQGLASMIPPLILDPKETDCVLDACAAPGSKTTQMAASMNNHGQIIANDMSKVRLYKLAANIKTLGVTTIQTTHFRAQDLWRKFPETFDKSLVDVPCSLEGRFFTENPKTYSNWSVKKIKILSEHQKHILRSAISATKRGGTIVYSTCTMAPEENEGVIDWILQRESGLKIVPIQLNNISTNPGITSWLGHEYNKEVSKCLRIIPTKEMEAFFVAKLVKE